MSTHEHADGAFLQFLPRCLAPELEDRGPDSFPPPRAHDPIVINDGQVLWLQRAATPSLPATEATTRLWAAPMYGGGGECGGARWKQEYLIPIDPDYTGLDEGDPETLRTCWRLLLEADNGACRARPGQWTVSDASGALLHVADRRREALAYLLGSRGADGFMRTSPAWRAYRYRVFLPGGRGAEDYVVAAYDPSRFPTLENPDSVAP